MQTACKRFLLLWPWPWPDDLVIRTWPRYSRVLPVLQKWTFRSWLSKVRALQIHRRMRPNALPRHIRGSQNC